jgi:hypothetical protein
MTSKQEAVHGCCDFARVRVRVRVRVRFLQASRPRFRPVTTTKGYVGTKTIYISILTDLLVLSNGLILSNEDLELPVILTISLNLRSSFYRDL